MSDIFYSADGQVQNVDLVEHMTSDQYYLDGSLKIAGSIISKSFLNESGEPIGLPKNVEVKGSLRVNDKTGIWKMCYLTAIIITIFTIFCNNANVKHNSYFYILVLIITFFILYLFKNFENFHKYKPNTNNGDKIIDFINKNCINKSNNSTPINS